MEHREQKSCSLRCRKMAHPLGETVPLHSSQAELQTQRCSLPNADTFQFSVSTLVRKAPRETPEELLLLCLSKEEACYLSHALVIGCCC